MPFSANTAFIQFKFAILYSIINCVKCKVIYFIWFASIIEEIYEGENETYIEASVENSSSILYDKEIRNKPRTRRTKRNV